VAAFEPSTLARRALEDNVALNRLTARVRVFPVALGAEAATASFTTAHDVGNHLVLSNDHNGAVEPVSLLPLDAVVQDDNEWFAGAEIVLMKIDAEGYDEEVLQGAHETIRSYRPVVLVETWNGGARVRAALAKTGYRVYHYDIDSRALIEYPPAWGGQANFIGIPDDKLELVRRRLRESPRPDITPPKVRWLVTSA
jgi:FkbM family methyltransferase